MKPGQKDAYRDIAAKAAPIFAEHGAMRTVECWGALMAEGLVQQNQPVWDGPRAIFAGFAPILDTGKQ